MQKRSTVVAVAPELVRGPFVSYTSLMASFGAKLETIAFDDWQYKCGGLERYVLDHDFRKWSGSRQTDHFRLWMCLLFGFSALFRCPHAC